MNLRLLLIIHAIITLAAAIVLIVFPAAIPKTVGIEISPKESLLCYFLGAAEFGVAYLSFFARKITDYTAIRIIVTSFIVFHLLTGFLELYAFFQGISIKIIGNIFLRLIVSVLFYHYGIRKAKAD